MKSLIPAIWFSLYARLLYGTYEVWSKNNRYFQISWVKNVRFSRFFSVMLVHMSIMHVCWQYQPFWIVSLFFFLTDKKGLSCFGVVSDFLLFKLKNYILIMNISFSLRIKKIIVETKKFPHFYGDFWTMAKGFSRNSS